MTFESIPEFDRDVKFLLKKYKTLEEDINVVRKVLEVQPNERPPFSFRINDLGINTCVIKVKKMACKALKGIGVQSGLRLIYAHIEAEKRIVFIELYHKNDKETEDRKRIFNHLK